MVWKDIPYGPHRFVLALSALLALSSSVGQGPEQGRKEGKREVKEENEEEEKDDDEGSATAELVCAGLTLISQRCLCVCVCLYAY